MNKNTTLNYQLTAFAQGHANDMRQTLALAERLAPTVEVPGTTGQYKMFDDINSFQTYDTNRPRGGDPTRIIFKQGDGTFNCKPQALEVTVDEEDKRDAGTGAVGLLDPSQVAVKALVNARLLSHARKVVDFVGNQVAAESGLGEWSNPDIDPIKEIDDLVDDLSTQCGSVEGVKLTISLTTWRTIRNHPKVMARCQGVQVAGVSLEQFRSLLSIPVDTQVHAISYNTAKPGQAATKTRLQSNVVLLTYSVPNPTQYDPSAFKRFTAGVNGVMAVRTWKAPNGLYEGHLLDWSEDLVKTSAIAARKITVS